MVLKRRVNRVKVNTTFNRRRNRRKVTKIQMNQSKHFRSSKDMVIYISPQLLPYPPRYRTKFHCDIIGNFNSGAAGYQAFVGMNYIYLPYAGGGWGDGQPNIATLNPTGYSSMVNTNLYMQWRVYASTIQVKMIPQSISDAVQCTITPSRQDNHPATVPVALTQPYTKDTIFRAYSNDQVNPQGLRNSISMHKLLGVSKRAIVDDLSGSYTGAYNGNPAQPQYWVVNFVTPDGANLSQSVEYSVRMTYYVELYGNNSGIMIET